DRLGLKLAPLKTQFWIYFSLGGYEHHQTKSRNPHLQTKTARVSCGSLSALVPGAILGRHIISPQDLARYNPNSGPGDPYAGSLELAQNYLFRPLPSQPSHQTCVPNIFLVGAGTWPGAGVNGSSGYIVAQQLLTSAA